MNNLSAAGENTFSVDEKLQWTQEEAVQSYLLYTTRGIGAVSIRRLIEATGSASAVSRLSQDRLTELIGEKRTEALQKGKEAKRQSCAVKRFHQLQEKGIFFLPYWMEGFPKRLAEIPDPPVALFGMGRMPDFSQKTAAVIGARECSGYGRQTAAIFAAGLASAGVTIVSGMARGVDGIAQRAALDAGGSCVAVLGCGVDICYPPENRILYERLKKEGCLLSEYPPGTQPQARFFPERNRIISGLSDLVLVTEAREKSGTLITVDMALEQGRDVYAVPGRITDSCSVGCNRLIANGAGMAVSVSQLLQDLNMKKSVRMIQKNRNFHASDGRPLSNKIMEVLDCNPMSLDEIAGLLSQKGEQITVQEVMEELILLCMEEKAGCHGGMYFSAGSACIS
ncbi:MAG: DNA-processing protein DprA [Lachnospiraceae bacterium]|nr:DNA-processing protein DprA [Lachnospiraceae bacterium]